MANIALPSAVDDIRQRFETMVGEMHTALKAPAIAGIGDAAKVFSDSLNNYAPGQSSPAGATQAPAKDSPAR